ncbi:AtzH-like domain-containing protein [Nocardia jiangxiensis]|uniref:AtzH-like domain-containing protein n=1 Tax=Nocardia jiangxiensis TaxID=282685 RepID=UPI0003102815|nr:AtzH-like domain-containing protein [Nocardia jiangxiensis]
MTFDDLDDDLRLAFAEYERALMANDVPALDAAFADGPRTLRGDSGDVLVGHDAIAAFRAGRGGAPARTLLQVHTRSLGPDARVIVAQTRRADGMCGIQTQVWERSGGRWAITVAHVSAAPTPVATPTSPDDPIWRVAPGPEPLARGGDGPLTNTRVAVKDLFAVAGQAIGAGNPVWLSEAPIESRHAAAVEALLAAGADVTGIAHTDELAFSLSGSNAHYGDTPNPVAPQCLSGGSSSGPAAAVAAGLADIGLGTDTAGSIRVPASYCGLYGLRTTHGVIDRTGLVGLAPSFDSVGLLTRDAGLLARAGAALLPPQSVEPITRVVVAAELVELLDPAARESFRAAVQALTLCGAASGTVLAPPVPGALTYPDSGGLDAVFTAFRTVQTAQAWDTHGELLTAHPDALSPEIAARFHAGRDIDSATRQSAQRLLDAMRAELLRSLPPGTVLALPSTSSAAPRRDTDPALLESVRQKTLRLTCLASLAGLPALSIPAVRADTRPIGLCLVAAPGQDHSLLAFASAQTDPL